MTTRPEWSPPRWLEVSTGWSWRLLVIIAAGGIAVVALGALSSVVLPLLLGLILTSVLAPVTTSLRRRGWRPAPAAAVGLLILLLFIAALGFLVLGALVGPWTTISRQIGDGIDVLVNEFNQRFDGDITNVSQDLRSSIGNVAMTLLGGVLGIVGVAVALITTTLLTLTVVFFYLKDGDTMWAWFLGHQRQHRDLVDRVGRSMWEKVNAFVRGTAAVALVDAIGIGVGAWILGVPSVLAIAVLTFALAFIPFFGAFIAGAIAVTLALADGGLSRGLVMVLIVVLVQQLESNLLQPVLVGRAVRLHPLVVALGVIAGGSVGGVLGMFLAIPLIAAVTAAVNEVRLVHPPVGAGPAVASDDAPVPEFEPVGSSEAGQVGSPGPHDGDQVP